MRKRETRIAVSLRGDDEIGRAGEHCVIAEGKGGGVRVGELGDVARIINSTFAEYLNKTD